MYSELYKKLYTEIYIYVALQRTIYVAVYIAAWEDEKLYKELHRKLEWHKGTYKDFN